MTLGLVLVFIGFLYWHFRETSLERAKRLLAQARVSYLNDEYQAAEDLAKAALDSNPELGKAALFAARCAFARKDYSKAVHYADQVPSRSSASRVKADLLIADLYHHHFYQFDLAEKHYRAVLAKESDNLIANRNLAGLLGLCGRGREAYPYVLQTIQLGQPTDQLFMIARETGAVDDKDSLERARSAAPQALNPLLGLAWQASSKGQHQDALTIVEKAAKHHPNHVSAYLAFGRELLALANFDRLIEWGRRAPENAEQSGEYWFIQGRLSEKKNDTKAAIRCYWEAIKRNPESKSAYPRLIKLLAAENPPVDSSQFADYYQRLLHLQTVQNRAWSGPRPEAQPVLKMAMTYERLGRIWEAYGWTLLALNQFPQNRAAREYMDQIRKKTKDLSLQLTIDAANPAMHVDLSSYPLPRFLRESVSPRKMPTYDSAPITFRDESERTGLIFQYFNGSTYANCRKMFAFTGGGIGVLDFDLDGFSDTFFSQGQPWPLDSESDDFAGQLFRNQQGKTFANVSSLAGIRKTGFGQGVAVGDYNADGFPDLYLAHIGTNQLWINNGDGTFSNETQTAGLSGDAWTTSCLFVDLSGDGLPDLYDVNYLKGKEIFERVCRHPNGTPALCMPFDFDAETDRFWLNAGDGQFIDVTKKRFSTPPRGKGLGAVAWAPSGSSGLSLLVANDTTPNFFFVPEGQNNELCFHERGLLAGLACNGEGKAEGCMGIALADVDGNGLLDVHITNFLAESNTLWMQEANGLFEDSTRTLGLHTPTFETLGFGTQFLDADLDGRWELFVANGHIDDLTASGRPYEMAPQLFQWNGNKLVAKDNEQIGGYFQRKWLGRAAARLDWNRDGLTDILVGHIKSPSVLLTNTTHRRGQFLSLKLIGTQSGRDAIGTSVTIRVNDTTYTSQLAADGGYHASNERRLVFGIGDASRVDKMVVEWLSGEVQTFHNIPVPGHLLLIEGGELLSL